MSPKESVKNDRVVELIKEGVDKLGVRGLSRAVGISPAIITRYTHGKVGEPSQSTLEKLADYFKTTVADLRGEILKPVATDNIQNNRALKFAAGNLDAFKRDKNSILKDKSDIRYLYRDIALLVLTLPEGYYDEELLKDCKTAAKDIVTEIIGHEKVIKK